MTYACTYCSREKSDAPGDIPAKERYSSKRIKEVLDICARRNLPLLFLSGKYGLIKAEKEISFYNQRLVDELVPQITELAIKQAKELEISELIFFTKSSNDKLRPYYEVMEAVSKQLGINLIIESLNSQIQPFQLGK